MKAGIALGSNVGDRLEHLLRARRELALLHCGARKILSSDLYETEPVGCVAGTASFLNAVVEIETALTPEELLAALRGVEKNVGRVENAAQNAPRILDLDLLYMDNLRRDLPGLKLPHPRLTERRFVLEPLGDIRPDLVLPGQREFVRALLRDLPAKPGVERLREERWQ